MNKPLVRIENVSIFIPGLKTRQDVLHNINLNISPGKHLALLGPNGSGKSSLLRLIHGDLWPRQGNIFWHPTACDANASYDASPITARELTGIISPQAQAEFQVRAWDVKTCDILAGAKTGAPLSYSAAISSQQKEQILALAQELGFQDWLELSLPAMSQGQLRLILLARELLRQPKLLLLDEWADGLDAEHKNLALAALTKRAAQMTMFFAAHRENMLPAWAHERIYIEAGRIVEQPTAKSGISAINKINSHNFAAPIKPSPKNNPEKIGQVIFELKNVSVYLERDLTLQNINWSMRVGEHWQITGGNGSGKSTFLRLLAGDEFVAAGGSLKHWSPKFGHHLHSLEEKRQSVVLVSDLGQALYGYNLTGNELILSGCDNTVGVWRDFTKMELAKAKTLLKTFFPDCDSDHLGATSIRRLSSGQLRRLFLARALMPDPDVLLLDEPCTGLDADSQKAFLKLLNALALGEIPGFKPQIVLVSHYMEDCPTFINRRCRMEAGKLFLE